MDLKRGTLLTVLVMALMVMAQTAHAADNSVSLANLGISPQPVFAGSNVSIRFQLYNSYQNTLDNVDMWLQGSYPILNYSPTGTTLISSLGEGLYGGIGNYYEYNLHIPQNVQAGTYTIDVMLTYQLTGTSEGTTPGESIIPVSFYVTGTPSISLNANPVTQIVPGETSTLDITGVNTGTDTAVNASITVLSNSNFTVVGPSTYSLGTVAPEASAAGSFAINTNRTISAGMHALDVVLEYDNLYGAHVTQNLSIQINVPVDKPDIVASIVGATPQYLYSGSSQTLELAIQNTGIGTATNVSVTIPSGSGITVGSSSSDFFVSSIAPGAETTEEVYITANKNNNATAYAIPVQLKYLDANYENTVNATQNVVITLQRSAEFNVTSEVGSLPPGAASVPVTFMLKNTGNEEAQAISVSLQAIYPISPADADFYIASLAPGQTANATFYVNVDTNGDTGSYPVTLYEQWSQPNGASSQQYTGSTNYYAAVGSQGSALSTDYTYAGIVVLIVVIAGVIYMRRKKAAAASKKAKPAARQAEDEENAEKPAHKRR